jgi:hypothetical protein
MTTGASGTYERDLQPKNTAATPEHFLFGPGYYNRHRVRLPQDLANLLAVATRDVLWFKPSVLGFLTACGVESALMKDVKRLQLQSVPTIKILQSLYERLDTFGEAGEPILRKMLTDMY